MVFSQNIVSIQEHLQALLRANIEGFLIGLLVLFGGLAALAVHLMRLKVKDRTALWFGLFAGLYGLRALSRNGLVRVLLDTPNFFWGYLDSIVSNVILTPALLFFEDVYGKGWRGGLRWLLWAQGAWGAIAIAADFVRHNPGQAPDPSNLLLFALLPLLVVGALRGYRPPQLAWSAIIFAGGAIFLLSVTVDHLRNAGLTPWRTSIEPLGFLVNLACLGYVAMQRFVGNEQRLVAIEQEMKAAARIQESILPRVIPAVPGLDIAVRYRPMTAVAGDFYDFLMPGSGGIGILVADVTGHGVPAALVASMVKVAISSQAANASDPGQVIAGLNEVLCRQVQGQFTTAGYLFVDRGGHTARYAAAGHPPLLLWRKPGGILREYRENGLLMGVRPAEEYANMPIELHGGDRLLLYTDGVLEAADSQGEFFGEERLADFAATREALGANAFADALVARLTEWSGGVRSAQTDDISLIVVDVQPQPVRS